MRLFFDFGLRQGKSLLLLSYQSKILFDMFILFHMKTKNNSKQGYNSVQGLRSFKDTLPTKVKKIMLKKVIFILELWITGNI